LFFSNPTFNTLASQATYPLKIHQTLWHREWLYNKQFLLLSFYPPCLTQYIITNFYLLVKLGYVRPQVSHIVCCAFFLTMIIYSNILLSRRCKMRKFFCYNCNHEWEVQYGIRRPITCPVCKNTNIQRVLGRRSRKMRKFSCYKCNHKWEVPSGTARPIRCPDCKSTTIHRVLER